MQQIETDYLVIGAGTTGLAFTDTLITESDADVVIVDRHGKPGGHWNDAYTFVNLHQPSSFYGVNSLALGTGLKDLVGLNQGLSELASGPEVCAYFERVMNHSLLPSGRVRYHPLCNHLGHQSGVSEFESLLSGARTRVKVRKKVVDATRYSPTVPSTHTPRFHRDAEVRLVPPNALPHLWQQAGAARRFVVLGAGKTAMDACLWLLQTGAEADAITWVMPRDAWLANRLHAQVAPEFFHEAMGGVADQLEALATAGSVDELFLRLEARGLMLRIAPDHTPTMFHFATVSQQEVEVLRRIRNVVRLGRVKSLHADHMVLDQGRFEVPRGALFIDCTASATDVPPPQPVFQGDTIVPQLYRAPLIAMSAALTGFVEARYDDEATKNRLCRPIAFPHTPAGYVKTMMDGMLNQYTWSQDKPLRDWMRHSRLDGFGQLAGSIEKSDIEKLAVMGRIKEQSVAAMANMPRLLAGA